MFLMMPLTMTTETRKAPEISSPPTVTDHEDKRQHTLVKEGIRSMMADMSKVHESTIMMNESSTSSSSDIESFRDFSAALEQLTESQKREATSAAPEVDEEEDELALARRMFSDKIARIVDEEINQQSESNQDDDDDCVVYVDRNDFDSYFTLEEEQQELQNHTQTVAEEEEHQRQTNSKPEDITSSVMTTSQGASVSASATNSVTPTTITSHAEQTGDTSSLPDDYFEPSAWRCAATKEGKLYYYHHKLRQPRWKLPEGMFDGKVIFRGERRREKNHTEEHDQQSNVCEMQSTNDKLPTEWKGSETAREHYGQQRQKMGHADDYELVASANPSTKRRPSSGDRTHEEEEEIPEEITSTQHDRKSNSNESTEDKVEENSYIPIDYTGIDISKEVTDERVRRRRSENYKEQVAEAIRASMEREQKIEKDSSQCYVIPTPNKPDLQRTYMNSSVFPSLTPAAHERVASAVETAQRVAELTKSFNSRSKSTMHKRSPHETSETATEPDNAEMTAGRLSNPGRVQRTIPHRSAALHKRLQSRSTSKPTARKQLDFNDMNKNVAKETKTKDLGNSDQAAPQTTEQCPHCNRKFAPGRLEVHEPVCERVFIQRRHQYDTSSRRLKHTPAEKFHEFPLTGKKAYLGTKSWTQGRTASTVPMRRRDDTPDIAKATSKSKYDTARTLTGYRKNRTRSTSRSRSRFSKTASVTSADGKERPNQSHGLKTDEPNRKTLGGTPPQTETSRMTRNMDSPDIENDFLEVDRELVFHESQDANVKLVDDAEYFHKGKDCEHKQLSSYSNALWNKHRKVGMDGVDGERTSQKSPYSSPIQSRSNPPADNSESNHRISENANDLLAAENSQNADEGGHDRGESDENLDTRVARHLSFQNNQESDDSERIHDSNVYHCTGSDTTKKHQTTTQVRRSHEQTSADDSSRTASKVLTPQMSSDVLSYQNMPIRSDELSERTSHSTSTPLSGQKPSHPPAPPSEVDSDRKAPSESLESPINAEDIVARAPVSCDSCGMRFTGAGELCRHLTHCSPWLKAIRGGDTQRKEVRPQEDEVNVEDSSSIQAENADNVKRQLNFSEAEQNPYETGNRKPDHYSSWNIAVRTEDMADMDNGPTMMVPPQWYGPQMYFQQFRGGPVQPPYGFNPGYQGGDGGYPPYMAFNPQMYPGGAYPRSSMQSPMPPNQRYVNSMNSHQKSSKTCADRTNYKYLESKPFSEAELQQELPSTSIMDRWNL